MVIVFFFEWPKVMMMRWCFRQIPYMDPMNYWCSYNWPSCSTKCHLFPRRFGRTERLFWEAICWTKRWEKCSNLDPWKFTAGEGFKTLRLVVATQRFFICTPKIGDDSRFDENSFQMGWFNHQSVLKLWGGVKLTLCFLIAQLLCFVPDETLLGQC